jgi:hypothetical protein
MIASKVKDVLPAHFRNISDFGVLVIASHGTFVDDMPVIGLNHKKGSEPDSIRKDWDQINKDSKTTPPRIVFVNKIYCIAPGYITAYGVGKGAARGDGIAYLGCCNSMRNFQLADAFLSAGFSTVVGYTDVVSNIYAINCGKMFFSEMLSGSSATASFNATLAANPVDTNDLTVFALRLRSDVADASFFFPTTPPTTNGNWIDVADTSWYENNPDATEFEISAAEQLAGLAKLVNRWSDSGGYHYPVDFSGKTITLMNSLDLGGREWTPIGNFNTFNGTFDGGEHTISNLTIINEQGDCAGFFGRIGSRSEIKNLRLTKLYISHSPSSSSSSSSYYYYYSALA